jgi:hypothetical protein
MPHCQLLTLAARRPAPPPRAQLENQQGGAVTLSPDDPYAISQGIARECWLLFAQRASHRFHALSSTFCTLRAVRVQCTSAERPP